jgi:YHS domain-containing protein
MMFALWLLRVLIILLIVRYIVAFFTRRGPARVPRPGPTTRQPERTGGTLVRDPQCGTYVAQASAVALSRGGSTMYFCSKTCRDAWLSEQAK